MCPPPAGSPAPTPAGCAAALVGVALSLGACSGTGTATPVSIPPDATASTAPADRAAPEESQTPEPAATFPLTLLDDEGTEVDIPAAPQKIVSLTPATTEILFALGVGDRIVAKVEDITPYPPAADGLPVVAKFGSVDVEKIVALGADLVIAGGNGFNPPEAIAQLRRANIPVLVTYAANVEGVLADIELVGDAVGEGPAARDLTASMRAGFDQVAAAVLGLPRAADVLRARRDEGHLRPGRRLVHRRDDRAGRRDPDHDRRPGRLQHPAREARRGRPGGDRPRRRGLRRRRPRSSPSGPAGAR